MQTLLNSQQGAITKLHPLKVGVLFMRPGTGKSRTAVELIRNTDADYILWLAPYRSVNPKIKESGIIHEVNKWGGFDREIDFIGIESLSNSDRIYLQLLKKIQGRKTFIVCDESLKIKNEDAKRTKRIIELGRECEYKLILNGTPISRNLLDIWSQMQFLSPLILKMNYGQYKNSFCKYTTIKKSFGRQYYSKEFITGYANIDYLYSLIRPYVYEADLQLTVGQQYISIDYEIDDESKAEYKQLKEKYLDNEKLQFLNNNIFLEMTMKMQHVYCCTASKFENLKEIIKTHGIDNVIVYTKFIKSREEITKQFPALTVLSLQSDSMSLNLQDKNVTVEWDKTWDYALIDQYEHRTYRTGQLRDCIYYKLSGNIGLEALITANNDKKQNELEYFKNITKAELKEIL